MASSVEPDASFVILSEAKNLRLFPSARLRRADDDRCLAALNMTDKSLKPLNENIVQTRFHGIMSAQCTPEL
jgi:hypothetical protein